MTKRALGFLSIFCGVGSMIVGCGDGETNTTSGSTQTTTTTAAGGSTTTSSTAGSGGVGGVGGNTTSSGGVGGTTSSGGTGGVGGSTTSSGGTGGMAPESFYDCTPASGAVGTLKLTPIATGLNAPVLAISAPGNPDRLYIVQQGGKVLVWQDGQVLATPFVDVSGLLTSGGEQGLLGLAFHPDYVNNGRFFLHYSAKGSGDSTIMEFKRSGDPLVGDPNPVQLVVKHPTAQSNHNGGAIEFGNDGYLYISLGDGGTQNDPECDAQNLTNLLGKISRLDVDGVPDADGYPAAPGNPTGKPYHIGFRNPWRASIDACTGDLYIGDVGQNQFEEVDVVPTAVPAATNFGWPFREGKHNHSANACAADPGPWTEPIAEYDHGQGCSISGGYVYRGAKIPWLRGAYFYGDYCSARVWMLHYADGVVDSPVLVDGVSEKLGNISSFGQDGHGEVYVIDLNGSVQRIDPG